MLTKVAGRRGKPLFCTLCHRFINVCVQFIVSHQVAKSIVWIDTAILLSMSLLSLATNC